MQTFPTSLPILIASGVVLALGMLVMVASMLGPSAKTLAESPRVAVSDLPPASFKFVRHPVEGPRESPWEHVDVLLIRKPDGKLSALYIPLKDGKRYLPEARPWEPAHRCEKIEPDFNSAAIYCRDLTQTQPVRRWSLDGEKLQSGGTSLERVVGREESGDFVFFRPSAP